MSLAANSAKPSPQIGKVAKSTFPMRVNQALVQYKRCAGKSDAGKIRL